MRCATSTTYLTAAEERLANALLQGLPLQEYAPRQGVSIHTDRAQYKSAAAKVGVGHHADIVRPLLMGPAMLRCSAVNSRLQ